LLRGYEALLDQSSKDFCWLIVDDGSSDETGAEVEKWQNDGIIKIQYFYKENGGLHTAYNLGIERAESELFVCIDSDDFMPVNAVERIVDFWKNNGNSTFAGLIGQDYKLDGTPLIGNLPHVKSLHILDLEYKYGYRGDTKIVHRTELLKEVAPMPSFKNEKNFNPIYLFLKIDQKYPLLVLDENLCFVDYQDTGMANNILKQFADSPNSFAELRRLLMSLEHAPLKSKFRNAIHYVSSSFLAKNKKWLRESPEKLLTLCAVPFGVVLYLYLKYKTK
jgi:glycosyltransferase involved in cell wall biosynthesis